MIRSSAPRRRAFATVLVLGVIGIAAVILVSLQTTAWRDAADARQAVAHVRAKWAARAGIEAAIARLEAGTLDPDLTSAFTLRSDLAAVAEGTLAGGRGATYRVVHSTSTDRAAPGPVDEHAKININLMTAEALMLLPNMTEDVADAILDWIDADEEPRPLGAEAEYYATLPNPYRPRNGPIRTLQELELIAGVRPEYVRGEDWNLNGILDPEENDGDLTFPPDNADGVLDAGWSAIITASSVDSLGVGASGQPRLDLFTASAEEIASRLRVTTAQAEAIRAHAQTGTATLADFLRTNLATLAARAGVSGAGQQSVPPLTNEQLALLFDETTLDDPAAGPVPGKLNLNTCDAETLDYLPGMDPGLSDSIIFERSSRPEGFTSVIDLLAIPSMSRNRLAGLVGLVDVRSNVYTITSRGRDNATGIEVEMTATVDRSSLPATIRDLIVR
jgi:DNA uptake protein ComE-like DNA-binding protein